MAISLGGWVKELVLWHEADTMKSVGKIIAEFRRLHIARGRGTAFEAREAAMLLSRIGNIFINAGIGMG